RHLMIFHSDYVWSGDRICGKAGDENVPLPVKGQVGGCIKPVRGIVTCSPELIAVGIVFDGGKRKRITASGGVSCDIGIALAVRFDGAGAVLAKGTRPGVP